MIERLFWTMKESYIGLHRFESLVVEELGVVAGI